MQQTGYNSFFNDLRDNIFDKIKETNQEDLEDVNLLSDKDRQYLGDEAFLKYLVVKDEIEKVGEVLSKE